MTIPFIRKNPNGARSLQQITRGRKVEEEAAQFIGHAGRYLIEILPNSNVHLMAIIDKAEGCKMVAEEEVPNGPGLPDAVDRLVIESAKHIPIRILIPANTP